jgi:hypothetical protein
MQFLYVALDMGYINDEKFKSLNELSSTISKMIMGLINIFRTTNSAIYTTMIHKPINS